MWLYKKDIVKSRSEMPENAYGFVYIIRNKITGKYYIGKKALEFNRKKKLTKKELAEHVGPGRKPTSRTVTTESDWLDYWGSNKNLLGDLREFNKENFTREILVYAFNKKQLTYYEVHYQCIFEVLLVDSYNSNILGKFYPGDFE